ncbi:hypothetical protein [Natronorarus salvus]|uniref:hypothetical protein n=1 Tax=Natronorarus salvus TaxID=3117733 RepID=UPI002F26D1D9
MTVEFDSFNLYSDTSWTGWASPNRFSARVQGGSQRGMTAENIRNGDSGQMDGLEIWTEAKNLEVIAELKH